MSTDYPPTFTGIDYAAPVYVKNIYNDSKMYKAWVFLFTCASTRIVYLDVVPNCSDGICIRALGWFFRQIGSDDGS